MIGFATGKTADKHETSPDVWFGATDPAWRVIWHLPGNDYLQLFQPNAPWAPSSSRVRVFEISKRFINETPDAQLLTVSDGLRRLHLKLAMQMTPLVATRACGLGVEGHGPPNDTMQLAAKLKRLHIDLAIVDMDEPLWYGHEWTGNATLHPCMMPIKQLAEEAASKIKAVRAIYPAVEVYDTEPIGMPAKIAPTWVSDLRTWLDTYRLVMGEPLTGLHLDIVWAVDHWQVDLLQAISMVHYQNIRVGIIYNGSRSDLSDAAWLANAEARYKLIEGRLHTVPDEAVFQSWMDFPRKMLPETESDSFTSILRRYAIWHH